MKSFIMFSILMLSVGNTCSAMEQSSTYTMPGFLVIYRKLESHNLGFFADNTDIVNNLKEKTVSMEKINEEVDKSIRTMAKEDLNSPLQAFFALKRARQDIINALVESAQSNKE